MIIWSGWGIVVVLIGAIGLLVGVSAGSTFAAWLPHGPAQSLGVMVGGLLASSGIYFFAKWRESGEGRVFIDEASGQRIEVRPSAGSLFFIPTRYWTWIVLALSALFAFTMFNATGPTL
jgi:hypothetical protein